MKKNKPKFQVTPKKIKIVKTVIPEKIVAPVIKVTQKDIDEAQKYADTSHSDRTRYCPIANSLVRTLNLKRNQVRVDDECIRIKDHKFFTNDEIEYFIKIADEYQETDEIFRGDKEKPTPITIKLQELELYGDPEVIEEGFEND